MKSNLPFSFTIHKASKTVVIEKVFEAELSLVWDAFTTQEILDQWWAPKPWKSVTKDMSFIVGGRRLYAMIGPEGQEHWSVQSYPSISPKTNFKINSSFTDPDGNLNKEMPSSIWDVNFEELDETTKVTITITHQSLENLETLIKMGFQEGFTQTLTYLEKLLSSLSKK